MFTNSLSLNFPCLAPRDSGSDSEILSTNMNHREPVILNVYDMVSKAVTQYVVVFFLFKHILSTFCGDKCQINV